MVKKTDMGKLASFARNLRKSMKGGKVRIQLKGRKLKG